MKYSKDDIENRLSGLKGVQLSRFGRAASMLWVGFGEDVPTVDLKGRLRMVSEYALHVSCAWRITNNGRMEIGNLDICRPRENAQHDDLDEFGNSLFDEKKKGLLLSLQTKPAKVNGIAAGRHGDLEIGFDNGWLLRLFPNDSFGEEYWRFFENGSDAPHFVVFENGE